MYNSGVSDSGKRDSLRPTVPPVQGSDPLAGERPTTIPPFDIETFARAQMENATMRGRAALEELAKRVRAGDLRGGLRVVESLVALEPDSAEVLADAERCRDQIAKLCEARLGSLSRVPSRKTEDASHISLDASAVAVLALVDGVSSYEMIVELAPLPKVEALLALDELRREGLIDAA